MEYGTVFIQNEAKVIQPWTEGVSVVVDEEVFPVYGIENDHGKERVHIIGTYKARAAQNSAGAVQDSDVLLSGGTLQASNKL